MLQKIVSRKLKSIAPRTSLHFKYLAGLVCVVVGLIKQSNYLCIATSINTCRSECSIIHIHDSLRTYVLDDQPELPFLSIFAAIVVFMGIILSVLSSDIVDVDYSLEALHTVFIAPELIFSGVLVAVIFLPRFCMSSGKGSANTIGNDTTSSVLDLTYRVVSAAILAMLLEQY